MIYYRVDEQLEKERREARRKEAEAEQNADWRHAFELECEATRENAVVYESKIRRLEESCDSLAKAVDRQAKQILDFEKQITEMRKKKRKTKAKKKVAK